MARTPLGTWVPPAIVLTALLAFAGEAVAAPDGVRSGDGLYRSYCATCHGTGGAGDGKLADVLRVRPPDLTTLARRSGGKFKADKVRKAIDGREATAGHGGSDMPVWGDALSRASEGYDPEAVKAKIDALVSHLESIQVK